jgi:DNA-binding MarR family transcriptional regulator
MTSKNDTWLPITDLAKARKVSKQALSKRVLRLEGQGLVTTKTGARGQKLVNVGEFDRAAVDATDAVGAQNGRKAKAPPMGDGDDDPFSPVLAREQARKVAYQADIAKLDRDERLGRLLPIENIAVAAAQCAEALNRMIDQLPGRADEIAAAVAKEGVSGVRALLRSVARDMRERLADEMQRLATMSGEASGPQFAIAASRPMTPSSG